MKEIVSAPDQNAKQTKGQKRKAEIVELARELLVREGYDQFVLRTIAERAEIKLGNLQYYFPTREDLLETVGEQEFFRGLQMVHEAAASSATPKEKLTQLVQKLVGDWQQTGGRVYAVISMLALHQDRFKQLHERQYRLFYRSVGDLLRALDPNATNDVLLRKARLVTTLMDGALFQVATRGRGSRAERNVFQRELLTAIQCIVEDQVFLADF